MVARMPDDAARDFVRAWEMFPGRGRSSHPTPAKGACVPRYAASERMPGRPGAGAAWRPQQHKTAAAKAGSRGRLEIVSAGRLGDQEKGPTATPMAQAPRRPAAGSRARRTGRRPANTPPGRGTAGSAPGGPVRAVGRQEGLVRGLVLHDDRRGDTAALADLVPVLLGPGPDVRTALTARPAARATAAATGCARPASVLCVLPELLAQFLGVPRAHIDLIGGPVKGERNRLRPLDLAVMWKVTHDRHHCLLSHGPALPLGHLFIGCQTYTRTHVFDNSSARRFANEFTTGKSGRR